MLAAIPTIRLLLRTQIASATEPSGASESPQVPYDAEVYAASFDEANSSRTCAKAHIVAPKGNYSI